MHQKLQRSDLSDRYSQARILVSEEMYGQGYQSSGGIELARELLPKLGLTPGKRLLDVGCGTGGTTLLAAREFGLHVTAVDRATDNIMLCLERASKAGLNGKIDLLLNDAGSYRFKPTHDGLWCCDALMYVSDKVGLFKNIAQGLVQGARAIILDYGSGRGQVDREFAEYVSSAGYHLPRIREYEQMLEGGGFACLEAVDYTDRFVKMMRDELVALQTHKKSFVEKHDETQFNHFVERWERKIRFCDQDLMRAFYFIAEKRS